MLQELPQDTHTECVVLGSCMISKTALIRTIKQLDQDCFYQNKNKVIFDVVYKLATSGQSVDLVTIASGLQNLLEEVGGMSYLTYLTQQLGGGSSANIDTYLKILKDKKAQRKAIELGFIISEMGYNGEEGLEEKIKEKAVSFTSSGEEDVTIDEAISQIDKQAVTFRESFDSGNRIIGASTGMPSLDKVLNGIQQGLFYVVGGYTSSGKSQFTLNLVNELLKADKRVLLLSLEMSPKQIATRMIAINSGERIDDVEVMFDRYRGTELTESQHAKIQSSRKFLLESKIKISMESRWSNIKAKLAEIAILKNFDVVVIDFLQNIESREEEYTKLTNISVELQRFARDNGITVITPSQISKDAQINKYDDVIAMKGSGAIGEKADCVMLISYDTKTYKKEDFDRMKAEGSPLPVIVNIQKNRGGRTGHIDLKFKTNTGKFFEEELLDYSTL